MLVSQMNRAILRVKLAKSNTVSNGQTDERRRMKEENLGHAIFLHPVSTIMELLTTCSDSTPALAALQWPAPPAATLY